MLAGPRGWEAEKSGHVRRLREGLQGRWSSILEWWWLLGEWFPLRRGWGGIVACLPGVAARGRVADAG